MAALGPRVLNIPSGAFISDGVNPTGYSISFSGGYFSGIATRGGCLVAPVNLPAGAVINGIYAVVNDSNGAESEWFDLYRIDMSTGATTLMGEAATPVDATPGVVLVGTNAITYPVVSSEYAYQVATCARPDINVYGVRVSYGLGTYLPMMAH